MLIGQNDKSKIGILHMFFLARIKIDSYEFFSSRKNIDFASCYKTH